MKVVTSPGCGKSDGFLGWTCEVHEAHIDVDGFTVHWHVQPSERGAGMWRTNEVDWANMFLTAVR